MQGSPEHSGKSVNAVPWAEEQHRPHSAFLQVLHNQTKEVLDWEGWTGCVFILSQVEVEMFQPVSA